MIRNKTARNLLYAWHGGASSPFYQAAGSGLVADWPALSAEVNACYSHASTSRKDRAELAKLQEYLNTQRKRSVIWIDHPADGKTYSALPWSKRYDH